MRNTIRANGFFDGLQLFQWLITLYGVADVVGYWAEDRIFVGVVLFGRGESGTGVSLLCLASITWQIRKFKLDRYMESQLISLACNSMRAFGITRIDVMLHTASTP